MSVRYPRHVTSPVLDADQRVGSAPPAPAHLTLAGVGLPLVGSARVYVCGITPYDVTHLGHAATFVWADLLAAVLDGTGVEVSTCRNVTDVDDVLFEAARRGGSHFDELAVTQEADFDRSMRALRVATPAHQPRVRHYVGAVVQLAQALLERGAAHERAGTVWFRGPCSPAPGSTATARSPSRRRTAPARPIRPRTTRSTSRCGGPPPTRSRPGGARGVGAGRAGTRSVPRWR